jgi:hypothetical protein
MVRIPKHATISDAVTALNNAGLNKPGDNPSALKKIAKEVFSHVEIPHKKTRPQRTVTSKKEANTPSLKKTAAVAKKGGVQKAKSLEPSKATAQGATASKRKY